MKVFCLELTMANKRVLNFWLKGLFGGGVLGDRYDPRVVLSIGMWLSAIVVSFLAHFLNLRVNSR